MKKLTDCINEMLENFAEDMVCKTGTTFFWGEVEVPESLKKEIEADELNL